MPSEGSRNTEPKDEGKELESTVDQTGTTIDTVTEEPPPVREITQTDRINKRLLVSLLENMNKNQFFDMGNTAGHDAADSSENPDTDADWK
ncbi:uncharacterized protein LOC119081010 [Bradysia coprophila]|uniref:uncharacterized protein LOC119081010 n=1 Tax=Bradysia coprophila TaxID=38358 RepID=UPI00187D91AE|nr:uncharacterized protein LOC119081010 [Bradysia coprophila]